MAIGDVGGLESFLESDEESVEEVDREGLK